MELTVNTVVEVIQHGVWAVNQSTAKVASVADGVVTVEWLEFDDIPRTIDIAEGNSLGLTIALAPVAEYKVSDIKASVKGELYGLLNDEVYVKEWSDGDQRWKPWRRLEVEDHAQTWADLDGKDWSEALV